MKTVPLDPTWYPHAYSRQIQLYETDAFGHTNNVSFFAFLESARFDLLKQLEFFDPQDILTLHLILAHLECNYRKIVRFNDRLTIYTRVVEIGSSSFTLEHILVRERDREIVADGNAVLVAFDHKKDRPRRLSLTEKEKLERYRSDRGKNGEPAAPSTHGPVLSEG